MLTSFNCIRIQIFKDLLFMLSFLKGNTSLHAAVMKGDHDLVKTLLQSKADVNARNYSVS